MMKPFDTPAELASSDLDLVVCGFPGKSACHGGLGWSTVAMLRQGDRVALVDAGNFGMRKLLIEQLDQGA